jgi:F1F0 ATPase subunit 2
MMGGAGYFAVGLLAGALHFRLLRWNATLYVRAGGAATAMLVQILRLGVLAGGLAAAAMQGAMPLLLAALGVVIARPIVTRWTGSTT